MQEVNAVDDDRQRDDFDMGQYEANKGKALYILYLKMFDSAQNELNKLRMNPPTHNGIPVGILLRPGINYVPDGDDAQSFDVSKPDPFENMRKEWPTWTGSEQRAVLDELWELLLDYGGNEKGRFKYLGKERRYHDITQKWTNLTQFEARVYLLNFCLFVSSDLENMDGIKDIDLVDLYQNLPDARLIHFYKMFEKERTMWE